jgi:hypothetical protein
MGGILGGGGGGPSPAEIARQQEEAANRERDRLAMEAAQGEAKTRADFLSAEQRRMALAAENQPEADDEQRRKFLRGA